MRFLKKKVPLLAVILLSSNVIAAPTAMNRMSMPLPLQPSAPASHPAVVVAKQPAVIAAGQPTAASAKQPVYADTSVAQTSSQKTTAVDVNTNIPYESMLPKDAEIVAGDPAKNEFFIVAAEDAVQIKKLLDRTKPGTEMAANDIKSKKPILKVKLDESNATLVSMDVMTSVKEVAKSVIKPSVHLTENDEVLSIFTKNQITPVGSRAVVAAVVPKAKPTETSEEKPMLKLLAANEASPPVTRKQANLAIINPLTVASAVKPVKGTIPDAVTVQHTIQQQPTAKPVELPLASKESAPTLEMVLQQSHTAVIADASKQRAAITHAKVAAVKVAPKAAELTLKSTVKKSFAASNVKAVAPHFDAKPKVATKSVQAKVALKTTHKKVVARKTVAAGKVIPYEQIEHASQSNKKVASWNAKHKAVPNKIVASTKNSSKKHNTHVGVVKNYEEYLAQSGQGDVSSAD